MTLTKTQRERLAAKGFSKSDIDDIDVQLEDNEESEPETETPSRREPKSVGARRGRRVVVLEDEDADDFMDRMFPRRKDEEAGDVAEEAEAPKDRRARAADDGESEPQDEEGEGAEAKDDGPSEPHPWFKDRKHA